jgi:hypothetical protein
MISDREREAVLGLLDRSRQGLLDAVNGLTDAQARWKTSPERWSVLEYTEHLAVGEEGLLALVKRVLETPAKPESEEERKAREKRIRETPMPKGVNHAPAALLPAARFGSLDEAIAAFLSAREKTVEYARTTQDDLRSHFAPHSVLGPLDGYQWLGANGRHAEMHSGHIRELRAMEEFPKS